jgi:hypothetical protein
MKKFFTGVVLLVSYLLSLYLLGLLNLNIYLNLCLSVLIAIIITELIASIWHYNWLGQDKTKSKAIDKKKLLTGLVFLVSGLITGFVLMSLKVNQDLVFIITPIIAIVMTELVASIWHYNWLGQDKDNN